VHEELKYKPYHLDKLFFNKKKKEAQLITSNLEHKQIVNQNISKILPFGCHISDLNLTDGGLFG
jgi:hypothetical protein